MVTLATTGPALAQGPVGLSHVALYVVDLQKSADFYKNALLLPEPFKDERHVWLRIGPHSQLHIIQGNKVQEHDINTTWLSARKTCPGSWRTSTSWACATAAGRASRATPRPDGVQQIYLQDPDGFWLEVNNDTF